MRILVIVVALLVISCGVPSPPPPESGFVPFTPSEKTSNCGI